MEEKINEEVQKAATEVSEKIMEMFNLKDQNLVLKSILNQVKGCRKNKIEDYEIKSKELIEVVNDMDNLD